MILTDSLKIALMVTSFVFIMMLLIEYVNVATQGMWQNLLKRNRWAQYFIAAFLGAVPGCMGAFSVVALYSHNVVSFGALVTAMIATSGDEAFVMFSLFPLKAAILTSIMVFAGIAAGYFTDIALSGRKILPDNISHEFEVHADDYCLCFPKGQILRQLKNISFQRVLLIIILILILCGTAYDFIISRTFN